MGHEERFPSPRVSAGYGFRKETIAGMLFDGDGNRMTPTHAVKNDTRYRYYVSRPLITNLSPVGAISPRHARLCRPRWLIRPATLAEKRGFST